jgi:hypothetical protein
MRVTSVSLWLSKSKIGASKMGSQWAFCSKTPLRRGRSRPRAGRRAAGGAPAGGCGPTCGRTCAGLLVSLGGGRFSGSKPSKPEGPGPDDGKDVPPFFRSKHRSLAPYDQAETRAETSAENEDRRPQDSTGSTTPPTTPMCVPLAPRAAPRRRSSLSPATLSDCAPNPAACSQPCRRGCRPPPPSRALSFVHVGVCAYTPR